MHVYLVSRWDGGAGRRPCGPGRWFPDRAKGRRRRRALCRTQSPWALGGATGSWNVKSMPPGQSPARPRLWIVLQGVGRRGPTRSHGGPGTAPDRVSPPVPINSFALLASMPIVSAMRSTMPFPHRKQRASTAYEVLAKKRTVNSPSFWSGDRASFEHACGGIRGILTEFRRYWYEGFYSYLIPLPITDSPK
jgi:hypothetical protein